MQTELNLVLQLFQAKPITITDFFCAKDVEFDVFGVCSLSELRCETWTVSHRCTLAVASLSSGIMEIEVNLNFFFKM